MEVETGPGRHPNRPGRPGQVYANWEKSRRSMTVWFLVYNEKDRCIVEAQLDEMGVKRARYECTIISYDDMTAGTAMPLPPGFDPVKVLPHCGERAPLDALLLGVIPREGIPATQIRKNIPDKYTDLDVAEAVDRLKRGGLLESRRVARGRESIHRV